LKKEHASSTSADRKWHLSIQRTSIWHKKKSALLTCSNLHGIGSPLEIDCNRLANQCHPPVFSNLDAHIAGTRNHEKEEEEGKSAVAAKVVVLFGAKLSKGSGPILAPSWAAVSSVPSKTEQQQPKAVLRVGEPLDAISAVDIG
jgi:hypothetical protein